MGITEYGKKLRPREQRSVDYLEKVRNAFLYEKAMDPNEFAKYGGRRSNILLKAIDDADYIIMPTSIIAHETEVEVLNSLSTSILPFLSLFMRLLMFLL